MSDGIWLGLQFRDNLLATCLKLDLSLREVIKTVCTAAVGHGNSPNAIKLPHGKTKTNQLVKSPSQISLNLHSNSGSCPSNSQLLLPVAVNGIICNKLQLLCQRVRSSVSPSVNPSFSWRVPNSDSCTISPIIQYAHLR